MDDTTLSCDELDRLAMERPITSRRIVPLRDGETAEQFGLRLAVLDGQEVVTNAAGTIALPAGYREETDEELRVRLKAIYG
jgi:hypothetical protein